MPIIKSAQKRMRQEAKARVRNRAVKEELRSRLKALRAAVEKNDSKKTTELLSNYTSQVDKAVKKNLLHKNNAARKKSQASKLVKDMGETKTTAPKVKATKKPATKKATTKKAPAKKSAKK